MYEVDEFKNYEKALKALTEAEKYAEKSVDLSTRLSEIQKKIRCIEKYMETKAAQSGNPEDAMIGYRELLDDSASRDAMRVGDIFCQMFEHYCGTSQNDKAWEIVEEMRDGSYQISRYLDREMLDNLCAKVGKTLKDSNDPMMSPWGMDQPQSDGEDIDEEIEDFIG